MSIVFRSLVMVAAGCSLLELPAVLARQATPTPGPARYFNPQFSFDGTKVIFESTRDGKYTIYSINLDGSGLRKLTDSGQDDAQP
jgi:Tol biopolymer transport system component